MALGSLELRLHTCSNPTSLQVPHTSPTTTLPASLVTGLPKAKGMREEEGEVGELPLSGGM